MTHSELVLKATRWLKNTRRCGVVFTEKPSFQREIPDAIGWNGPRRSILIECKANLADFKADRKKKFRRKDPASGMGKHRYYLTPPGLLAVNMLPEFWGLLEAHGRRVKVVREAQRMPVEMRDEITRHEHWLFYYALYGVQNYGLTTLEGTGLRLPERWMEKRQELMDRNTVPHPDERYGQIEMLLLRTKTDDTGH